MKLIALSQEQEVVLRKILEWIKSSSKPYITLGGYAGTGKTTILAYLRQVLYQKNSDMKVAFCAYTGKASQVLKGALETLDVLYKGDSVSTIHSLIYTPIIDDDERIIGWQRKDSLDFNLIIVDEASMVDEKIFRDLLSYGILILAVGDHGQLPPISGKFNLMENPNLRLEKIFRQKEGNPIIDISIMARTRGEIPIKRFSDKVIKFSKQDSDSMSDVNELLDSYNQDTMILCGYNYTRVKLNKYIRSILNFESLEPEVGDKVICLRNNHAVGIYNGMLGTIQSIESRNEQYYYADILMEDGYVFSGLILKQQFNSLKSLNQTDFRKVTLKGDLFDFGYALTVHKAQGSQSKRVILFEEKFSKMDDNTWKRWLYTAVTRAVDELYIIG